MAWICHYSVPYCKFRQGIIKIMCEFSVCVQTNCTKKVNQYQHNSKCWALKPSIHTSVSPSPHTYLRISLSVSPYAYLLIRISLFVSPYPYLLIRISVFVSPHPYLRIRINTLYIHIFCARSIIPCGWFVYIYYIDPKFEPDFHFSWKKLTHVI